MNLTSVAKQYAQLTPEERFRLILAASGRGDEAERGRLMNAGGRITITMPDHSRFAESFADIAQLVFIELLEDAARYNDAFVRAGQADAFLGDDGTEEEVGVEPDEQPKRKADAEAAEAAGDRSVSDRLWQMVLAAGFVLRTKAEGWKLFCGRMSVPPFLLWEGFPGLDRLQRLLTLAESAVFVDDGFLRWLNRIRPTGEPEATAVPFTVEGVADATEMMFRECVNMWSS